MEQRDQQLNGIEQELRRALDQANEDIEEIDDQVRRYGEDRELAEGVDNHPGDESDQIYEQERLLTIRSSLVDRKRDIEHALTKVGKGTFGICERCGQQIETGRLEVIPFARFCRDCQEILDQQEATAT